jgi:hypothetical protein
MTIPPCSVHEVGERAGHRCGAHTTYSIALMFFFGSKASFPPDGVSVCRLDVPGNLPRIEHSAIGNGFNLHPSQF